MQGWIEQHVERFTVLGVRGVGALDLVVVDALEERLVGDAAQQVIEAHVDRVGGVVGQRQAVLQVGFGLVLLDLAGLGTRIEEGKPP